jgi:cytochrome c-type protein NapC
MNTHVVEGLTALVLGLVVLVLLVGYRPSLTATRAGKVLAFLGLFILPVLAMWAGTSVHLRNATSTGFCLSCHNMEPYGRSLRVDDQTQVPAVHFQNNLVPREEACFTCHTTYTMFGDLEAKLRGMKHVYKYYLGTASDPIELYHPYRNRECLHCHEGARSFQEREDHADIKAELASNETSCLDCHADIHDVAHVGEKSIWTEAGVGGER